MATNHDGVRPGGSDALPAELDPLLRMVAEIELHVGHCVVLRWLNDRLQGPGDPLDAPDGAPADDPDPGRMP